MKRTVYLLCIIVLFALPRLYAQLKVEKMVTETRYLLSLPDAYSRDSSVSWPLVLFLHGSGESGQDIEKVKAHGIPELVSKGMNLPFILVSPQSEVPTGWDIENLYRLIDHVRKAYRIDDNRIYGTGLSMGGFGIWALAMKYPDLFAAIAPVCGGGDTANAWKIRNIPAWVFHGARDSTVPIFGSIDMVNASRRFGAPVRFTVYPTLGHNSWDSAYHNDSLYDWMLAQQKHRYVEKKVSGDLKKYRGVYVGPDGDTVKIALIAEKLTAFPGKDTVPLAPAGDNLFFIRADRNMDIRFNVVDGKSRSFWFLGDRKLLYRRID